MVSSADLKSASTRKRNPPPKPRCIMAAHCRVIDIFCGAGGLAHGFKRTGFKIVAGIDADPACKVPFEENNDGVFVGEDIRKVTGARLKKFWGDAPVRILLGCAPCQPFSKYNQGGGPNGKWFLLKQFARLVDETRPEIISMENVKELLTFKRSKVYQQFTERLRKNNYVISEFTVYCPDYGLPQTRTRLVMFASKYGRIEIVPPTHAPDKYRTVRQAIGDLPHLTAGQADARDPLHRACGISDLNLRRIRASKPGGTWRDWPKELRLKCHKKKKGDGYVSVYGRMAWDEPSPTMTTQCVGVGNGRFGHPVQDRAISLREAAILQSFPHNYKFVSKDQPIIMETVARLIGNAVPVDLGKIIARSILAHLKDRPAPKK